jgi:hypothetical protein
MTVQRHSTHLDLVDGGRVAGQCEQRREVGDLGFGHVIALHYR